MKKNNKNIKAQFDGKKLIPGLNQILSKRPDQFAPYSWPGYFSKAKGAYVWDLDNNKYLDMSISSIGSVILGYADKDVDNQVIKSIKNGNSSSLNSYDEILLARLLCKLHPWANKVRYSKTGGEAMTIAIRIARSFNKKYKLAICGYHGWHDWYLAANLNKKSALNGHWLSNAPPIGVPITLKNSSFPFEYNNLSSLEKILIQNKNEISAVVMEPLRTKYPDKDYLKEVSLLAKKHKALLIFDEISSGFRISNGGAHLNYGVNPDIAVFSKALGNGYPISAIIGKDNVMQAAEESLISSSNWSDRSGLSAAIATINKYIDKNVCNHINYIGNNFKNIIREASKNSKLNISITGIDPMVYFDFQDKDKEKIMTAYVQLMLERKVLASNRFYANYSHKNSHLRNFKKNIFEVFEILSKSIKNNDIDKLLRGPVAKRGFHKFL